MWAIMVIRTERGGRQAWNTHSQVADWAKAGRVAERVGGAVVPWDMRLLLLDNGMISRSIRVVY